MSIFKRVAKTVSKKVVKPAARSFARGAKSTFNKTVGYGARSSPSFRQLSRTASRLNPVSGLVKTTRALNASKKSQQKRRY